MLIKKLLFKIFFFICAIFVVNSAWAIKVLQVKNNKLLIDLENTSVNVGDTVANGANTAEILQTKNNKAVAKVMSGQFSSQDKLTVSQNTNADSEGAHSSSNALEKIKKTKMRKWAVILKYFINTTDTQQEDGSTPTRTETVKMTGSGVGLGVTLDYTLFPWLTVHGESYLEPYNVKGTAVYNSCDGRTSKDCNANITYLSFAGFYRYDFIPPSTFNPWVGIGGVVKMPITKKTTALKASDIKYANSVSFLLGFDYNVKNKYFIPVNFQYYYSLNTSPTVPKIDQMSLQTGFGWFF